jgi:acetyl-CoA carboxylase biotin carboxyl carrier protein
MSFTMDDVMEVLQIVKECKDAELHIESGDLKLSILKGNVGDSTRSPLNFSGSACTITPSASQAPQAAPAPKAIPPDIGDIAEVTAAPLICGTAPGAVKEEISEEGLVPVKASVTSVFYRRPSPNEPPFVEVGDQVKEDTVLCLLEVMKCFRQVTADVNGVIEKICVESNHFVEQGTALFLIRPL